MIGLAPIAALSVTADIETYGDVGAVPWGISPPLVVVALTAFFVVAGGFSHFHKVNTKLADEMWVDQVERTR